uniref:Uncharacterized protein n=1 Tax=Panagrolaimus superbus TaxID=310955 RepID=A0A914ZHY8_9BILA
MFSFVVCGNVTYHDNPASLNEFLNNTVSYAYDISKQITEYLNNTIKMAYPEVMKVAIHRMIGSNPLKVSSLPEISSKIIHALVDRDLPDTLMFFCKFRYKYHTFVTTLTKDNVDSRYHCKINGECFDLLINNVRIITMRYLAYSNVTEALHQNDKFWNQTSLDLNFIFQGGVK